MSRTSSGHQGRWASRGLRLLSPVIICVFVVELSAPSVMAMAAEIIIEGVAKEHRDVSRPGQTTVIRPTEETRFDFESHLKADPSASLSNTGRTSGFSLPLFRGQDARSSHVFIGDMELQDPYSGLPMIDDIDLRAFGTMTIHKGFSPWNLPILDPGGVIQFTMRQPSSSVEGGLAYGDLSGANGWAKIGATDHDAAKEDGIQDGRLDGGIYFRRRTARGNYKYYGDNNTVLNSSDDVIKRRGNNDRSSSQGLGHFAWDGVAIHGQGLAWGQESEQGISVGQVSGDGSARVRAQTGVATASLRYVVTDSYSVACDVGHFRGTRNFSDPATDIGVTTKRTLSSQSTRGRISLTSDQPRLNVLASVERQLAMTKLNSTYSQDLYAPHAESEKVYAGANYKLDAAQRIEIKTGAERSEAYAQTASGEDRRHSTARPSFGSSIGWSLTSDNALLYAQGGRSTRVPSLMERIGNGAEIDGSIGLANEQSRAVEVGSRYFSRWAEEVATTFNLALWARHNEQGIQIDKISATRWRARNGGRRTYRGVEARVDLDFSEIGLEAAVSWIRAELVPSGLIVPRVPVWQAAGGARWRLIKAVTLRTLSRFVGRMYDDVSNTREIGWTLTHDLSADYSQGGSKWKVGFACNNVTNVMSTVVRDTVTGQNDGKMSYAGYSGEPLPGRSWTASVSAGL